MQKGEKWRPTKVEKAPKEEASREEIDKPHGSRRDFIKTLGAGIALGAVAGVPLGAELKRRTDPYFPAQPEPPEPYETTIDPKFARLIEDLNNGDEKAAAILAEDYFADSREFVGLTQEITRKELQAAHSIVDSSERNAHEIVLRKLKARAQVLKDNMDVAAALLQKFKEQYPEKNPAPLEGSGKAGEKIT